MRLAYKNDTVITIRECKSIPSIGILSFGVKLDWEKLNENNYFEVSDNPVYDPVTQYLGAYKLIENKAVRQVINKTFVTLEEEKAKKIKQLNEHYQQIIHDEVYPWGERAAFGDVVPQEIQDLRNNLRTECNTKEAEINALAELREVVSYGW